MSGHAIGILLLFCGLAVAGGGLSLARKYSAAANDTSLFRRHPRHHGWLGVLGQFIVLLGLSIALVGGMIGFG